MRTNTKRILFAFGIAAAAVVLSGCSSFNRQWRSAGHRPSPTDDITGRWEGTWRSDSNGHSDRLRCVITRFSETEYSAHFHAKYRRVLGFGYVVALDVQPGDGAFQFSGKADLGRLAGGVYEYEGRATPERFFSTYRSRHDHGTFEMTRPE